MIFSPGVVFGWSIHMVIRFHASRVPSTGIATHDDSRECTTAEGLTTEKNGPPALHREDCGLGSVPRKSNRWTSVNLVFPGNPKGVSIVFPLNMRHDAEWVQKWFKLLCSKTQHRAAQEKSLSLQKLRLVMWLQKWVVKKSTSQWKEY